MRLIERAGRDLETWDLDIIREEAPSSQQMYCQCRMLTRLQCALHLGSAFSRANFAETKGYG